ncbi:acyl-CoA dehydrogenase family protein [Parvibaculum sp.]|jgi:alkylation response protein AidB-like acyl-CoA dehydrogenase|uniref:acyl-CoA dehydrogenase family protein n=1 Tax=Parvibaculum sp. TaxID=2024848 RepID=UPI0025F2230C|nr:acyl-CoA dehydrogenase family protein [Parvibaculum sp.]|tara:strand:- start:2564 stop:2983 length:420 start_codon:yes stop_codon:yes gene_type:complete
MDLAYGSKYEAFREEVRAFLAKHKDQAPRGGPAVAGRPSPEACSWQRQLIQNGYATRAIPKDYGSYGAMPDILESRILAEEFSRARVSSALQNQGISMVMSTLLELGTEEQKKKWVKPTLRGEAVWCQGYSEPGSGYCW